MPEERRAAPPPSPYHAPVVSILAALRHPETELQVSGSPMKLHEIEAEIRELSTLIRSYARLPGYDRRVEFHKGQYDAFKNAVGTVAGTSDGMTSGEIMADVHSLRLSLRALDERTADANGKLEISYLSGRLDAYKRILGLTEVTVPDANTNQSPKEEAPADLLDLLALRK